MFGRDCQHLSVEHSAEDQELTTTQDYPVHCQKKRLNKGRKINPVDEISVIGYKETYSVRVGRKMSTGYKLQPFMVVVAEIIRAMLNSGNILLSRREEVIGGAPLNFVSAVSQEVRYEYGTSGAVF